MEAIVPPNPSLIVVTTLSAGSVANARNTETRKRAIKALIFKLDVRIIIAIMLIMTRIDVSVILMAKSNQRKGRQ
jgi:hypothetical protein